MNSLDSRSGYDFLRKGECKLAHKRVASPLSKDYSSKGSSQS